MCLSAVPGEDSCTYISLWLYLIFIAFYLSTLLIAFETGCLVFWGFFQDAPVLIIGHHILHGKVITLEKPLAVIMKVSHDLDSAGISGIDSSHAVNDQSDITNKETCYHVQAIIRKKILFKTRPKPIIAHVPKKL